MTSQEGLRGPVWAPYVDRARMLGCAGRTAQVMDTACHHGPDSGEVVGLAGDMVVG